MKSSPKERRASNFACHGFNMFLLFILALLLIKIKASLFCSNSTLLNWNSNCFCLICISASLDWYIFTLLPHLGDALRLVDIIALPLIHSVAPLSLVDTTSLIRHVATLIRHSLACTCTSSANGCWRCIVNYGGFR